MELLNFLHEDPMIAWFAFLALLLILVPAASVLWRWMTGRNQPSTAMPPARGTKPTHFGNQTELVVMLLGLVFLLAAIGWIYDIFFG